MIADWVAHGAEIGITAVAAIVVFGLIALALLGMLALGVRLLNDNDNANEAEQRRVRDDLHRR